MVLFRKTKRLEKELEDTRRALRQQQEQEREQERERKKELLNTQLALEERRLQEIERNRELENTRLALQQREREEKVRLQAEQLKTQIEGDRLAREARQRKEKQKKIKEASPETIRSLRELIREKYRLDVEIWGLRGARKPDRWLVELKVEKADAVVKEIMAMVKVWEDNTDGSWDPKEWERVQDIRKRLLSGGMVIWADNPLWNSARPSGC